MDMLNFSQIGVARCLRRQSANFVDALGAAVVQQTCPFAFRCEQAWGFPKESSSQNGLKENKNIGLC
jgi:hypothetical protein